MRMVLFVLLILISGCEKEPMTNAQVKAKIEECESNNLKICTRIIRRKVIDAGCIPEEATCWGHL